jgi:hypothetical protein
VVFQHKSVALLLLPHLVLLLPLLLLLLQCWC